MEQRSDPAAAGGSRVLSGLGRLGVVVLCIVVLVETVVLAALAASVALPLAVAPVVLVAVAGVLIIRDARRHSRAGQPAASQ